jgi:hypothetical protein
MRRLQFCHLPIKTVSTGRLIQMLGRIMRMALETDLHNKQKAIVIDYRFMKEKMMKGIVGINEVRIKEGSKKEDGFNGDVIFDFPTPKPDKFVITGISRSSIEEHLNKHDNSGEAIEQFKQRMLCVQTKKPKSGTPDYRLLAYHMEKDEKFGYGIDENHPEWFIPMEERLAKWLDPNAIKPIGLEYDRLITYRKKHPDFAKKLYKVHPDWIVDGHERANELKEYFLKKETPKPEGKEYRRLFFYIDSDKDFAEKLDKAHPDWISNPQERVASLKEYFLNPNTPKPDDESHEYSKLLAYLREDNNFKQKFWEIHPDWMKKGPFAKQMRKEYFLNPNTPKPKSGTSDYMVVRRYYDEDPEFRKKMDEAHPDWIVRMNETSNEQKAEFLKPDAVKPMKKDKAYGRLMSYVRNTHPSYDPDFKKDLMRIHPDWFPHWFDNGEKCD